MTVARYPDPNTLTPSNPAIGYDATITQMQQFYDSAYVNPTDPGVAEPGTTTRTIKPGLFSWQPTFVPVGPFPNPRETGKQISPNPNPASDPVMFDTSPTFINTNNVTVLYLDGMRAADTAIPLQFSVVPYNAGNVYQPTGAWTIGLWIWNQTSKVWTKPDINPTLTGTGAIHSNLLTPSSQWAYIQVVSLTAPATKLSIGIMSSLTGIIHPQGWTP